MLSNTWLKSNLGKKRSCREERADRDGLSVRLTQSGKVIFQIRYRYVGKLVRLDIGTYPLMTLKEARTENQRLRKELEQGYDPKIVRKLEKQAIIAAESFSGLFKLWYDAYCVKNKKGHHEIMRSFELYVFPAIGELPADAVTLHQWLHILEPLAERKPAIAERVLVNAKQCLKWGVKRQVITSNPLSDIYAKEDLQIKKRSRDRVLSDDEVKMVWLAVDRSRITPKNKLFVKLCLIYGCRNGELRQSEKKHFDFERKVWTIPAENHKLGKSTEKPLLRPITPSIEPYLKQAFELSKGSKYVFNNDGTKEMMSVGAPVQIPYNIMQYLRRYEGCELEHFTMHDLRRTARTNFSQVTDFHTAEIMLGHSTNRNRVVMTYDKYDYLKEQAEAYEAWCKKLFSMVKDEEDVPENDNIVEIDFTRRA